MHNDKNQSPAPSRPEKLYTKVITASEAYILKAFRDLGPFGQIVVIKQGGRLFRVESTENLIITPLMSENAALELKDSQAI